MTQPIQFAGETKSNAVRQVVAEREPLALRTFTPSQAVFAKLWADEKAAGRYFVAYQTILRGKWHRMNVTAQGTDQISGLSEDGYFRVALRGRQVRSEEGFAAPPV